VAGSATYLGLAEVFGRKSDVQVTTQTISFGTAATQSQGFLAAPAKTGRYPGMIMIHEWWGLNDQIRSMAHSLASEGYVVLAVDLFKGRVATTPEEARKCIAANPDDVTLSRLKFALACLREQPAVNREKIGVLGWCYGGGQSFELGVAEDLQAVVIFYGHISTEPEVLKDLTEPVLGIFGAEDQVIPVETVRLFEERLRLMGRNVEIRTYEGAGHAFANPTNSQAFRKEQAIDAWRRTLAFLQRTLQA
jgi:carboxymethylenebutenolidase